MEIIFQDNSLIAVDKPAGLAAIPGGWERGGSSALEVLQEQHGRLWIVHRLDRVTSGVLVFARSPEAHRALSRSFETRRVRKTYLAIACGVPEWDEYACRLPLLTDVGHEHRTAVNHEKGREALTRFRVRDRFAAHALLEASPETGRTHQIRAHLSALGFSILADRLYRAPATDLIGRPALHAASLNLSHPLSGEELVLAAPPPPDFAAALERLRAEGKGKNKQG
jgi:RluA family pseudouridine synthase